MGVPSDDAADWEGTYEKVKLHRRGSSVGLSVMGESETEEGLKAEIAEVISKAADLHPPYIELNASCPNLEKNTNLYDEPDVLKEILQGAKKVIRNRSSLFIKIPWLPPSKLKELIRAVGPEVDGVVFRNTIRVRPIRSREGKRNPAFLGREFGGLSGPCTFPTTLSGTRELRALKLDLKLPFAIIAVGGASNHGEVVELMKAGADGVQACTTPMFDPFFALKVRYGLTRVPKALRNLPVAESSGTHLVLPRTGTENESFEQLQAAVN
jgi:dihydroorotate dehydrogenase